MAVQKPNITWRGCPNYWPGRDGNPVLAIIDHIMQGTEESSDGWFKNRSSQVSAHFGVAKDGRIWQWVNLEDSAWANGIEEQQDKSIPWIAWADAHGVNLNRVTISIEHEGNTGEPMPEAQYQATLALHRWLLATYNIPADRNHINGHYQIAHVSRPNCPGTGFPWARLIADLAGAGASGEQSVPASNIPAGMVAIDNPNKLDIYKDAWSDPTTGRIVLQPFANFYRDNGGLEKFGRPTSGMYGELGSQEQQFKFAHLYVDKASGKVIAEMKDRVNPDSFSIGQGAHDTLVVRGFEAITNEQFYTANSGQDGLGQRSFTWVKDPGDGQVYILIGVEHPEQKKPDGSIPWEMKVVKEV